MEYMPEYGLDAATLLTLHYDGRGGSLPLVVRDYDADCIQSAMAHLKNEGISFPQYLSPFCHTQKNGRAFLWHCLFDCSHFSLCRKAVIDIYFKNMDYLRHSFLDCCLPTLSYPERKRLWKLEHPLTIQAVQKEQLPLEAETQLVYALTHFDDLIHELRELLWTISGELCKYAQSIEGHTTFLRLLSQPEVTAQLHQLSGVDDGLPLYCYLTILNPHLITCCQKEPHQFLMGVDFLGTLREKARYASVTPFEFALAVANPSRYDILKLLERCGGPVPLAQICETLHMSKSAARIALRNMQGLGLLHVVREKGMNQYSLDRGFIRCVASQLQQIGIEERKRGAPTTIRRPS